VPGDRRFIEGRSEQGLVVPYLLVDRRRRLRLPEYARALADGGAVALELGFPFSDPIADGPVLEAASGRALADGTRWSDLLEAIQGTARTLPTVVMTYSNPVWRHGLTAACAQLADAGAVGLIVPDLSLEESGPWRTAARRAGLDLVLLAAPGVATSRLDAIAARTAGFLYLVSRYGTTGAGAPAGAADLAPLVRAAHRRRPNLPVLVGFGVRDPGSARAAMRTGADGVIVGTALEERVAAKIGPTQVTRWVRSLVKAVSD
jgi:tryptophan synthase alpha chain